MNFDLWVLFFELVVQFLCRGGAWDGTMAGARSSRRTYFTINVKASVGVRPSRPIDRSTDRSTGGSTDG